ncbi:MAG: hypothetical protein QOI10_4304 [Solirubrobacterales bacterium]|nr:hypothetical protein [Solirubrobacterales bacterium]
MPRQPTDQQLRRDKRDEKTLVDASWALRRLTDKRFYHGQGATLYAVCEVLDRAALDISDVNPHVRSCLLRVAQAVVQDARIDAGEDPSKGLV